MNYCHICGGQSPDTALTSGPDPLMQEVGYWAYERLLLAGAKNAPSSLARPVVFDTTAVAHVSREHRLQFPVAEHSGKFQRPNGLNPIHLPPLCNTAVETPSRHTTSKQDGAKAAGTEDPHHPQKTGQHTDTRSLRLLHPRAGRGRGQRLPSSTHPVRHQREPTHRVLVLFTLVLEIYLFTLVAAYPFIPR